MQHLEQMLRVSPGPLRARARQHARCVPSKRSMYKRRNHAHPCCIANSQRSHSMTVPSTASTGPHADAGDGRSVRRGIRFPSHQRTPDSQSSAGASSRRASRWHRHAAVPHRSPRRRGRHRTRGGARRPELCIRHRFRRCRLSRLVPQGSVRRRVRSTGASRHWSMSGSTIAPARIVEQLRERRATADHACGPAAPGSEDPQHRPVPRAWRAPPALSLQIAQHVTAGGQRASGAFGHAAGTAAPPMLRSSEKTAPVKPRFQRSSSWIQRREKLAGDSSISGNST